MVDKKRNCLNLIRLLAAIQVFFGHAIPAFSLSLPLPLRAIFSFLCIFEGVPVFFCLSGFLLWDSIKKTPSLKVYAKKRIFRLYPELWCGVAVNFILVAILFAQNIEWVSYIAFQFTQATVLQFWTPASLDGYATGNPNGPLWTVSVLVQAYIALWFLHKFLRGKGLKRWIPTLILTASVNLLRPLFSGILPSMVYKLTFYMFTTHIWLFLVGAFMCEYFDVLIGWLKKFWWLALAISQVAMHTGFDYGTYGTVKCLFLAIGVIGLGYALPMLSIKHDFSYGFYIYHMIVINVMVHFGCAGSTWWLLVSFLASAALAVISYFTTGAISRHLRARASEEIKIN
ncbi:MAG: acyltransferase [Clostridia bacterium]|nr:acyltransferase [Clostridia bacterium]